MNIYLIGYMAAGKTTIGKELAKKLAMTFIDMDDVIETKAGMPLPAIFDKKGEQAFRKLENETLREVLELDNQVIATGGGTPCFYNNMQLMNSTGSTFYLYFSPNELLNRLKLTNLNTRPLLSGKTDEELLHFITKSLNERELYYLRANYKVDGDDKEKINHIIAAAAQAKQKSR